MRFRTALVILSVLATVSCAGDGFFRLNEYEEEIYLALDGSATVYVNTSVAALDALRGASFDASASATLNRDAIRAFFETPVSHVDASVKTSRRSNRQFVHVRMHVPDITRLAEAAPFAWSTYRFGREGELFIYRQTVGAAAAKTIETNWKGDERVSFRLHLPSKVEWHNGGPTNPRRGNILAGEQPLADRIKGVPLEFEARIETQSILYRALWLFGVTALVVVLLFGVIIWMIVRRGKAANRKA